MANEMRNRLVESIETAKKEWWEKSGRYQTSKAEADYIADHLIENGVVVPSCKIGDTVYKVVNDKRVKAPYECKVIGFWYSADENCNNLHLVRYVNGVFDSSFSVPFTDFGKTVFLIKEQAEQKLKEMRGGNADTT